MTLKDNVLKEYLKNVYFITGTPCGGKTTLSKALAERHGLYVYNSDERFDSYKECSDPISQPSMNKRFKDADEFFGRTVEEYKEWLSNNSRELLDFILLDLIRISQDKTVLCDCDLTTEQADRLTDPSRIIFLIREPSKIFDDYCNRPDHQGFNNFIHSATDFKKASEVCRETLKQLNEEKFGDVKSSKYLWIERDEKSTLENTLAIAERHFAFSDADKKIL